jgi:hypothetical protein
MTDVLALCDLVAMASLHAPNVSFCNTHKDFDALMVSVL